MSTQYLSASLKDEGYTGSSAGMPYKPVTESQAAILRDLYSYGFGGQIVSAASARATHINISFDGTQQGEFTVSGESRSNAWVLGDLQTKVGEKLNTIYQEGIGAQTVPAGTLDANGNPAHGSSPSNWESTPWKAGEAAQEILLNAYRRLEIRVNTILADNPSAEMALNLTGFSRGGAEAVAFANMLNERGIPGVYQPGQLSINSMALFDPVNQTSGVLNTTWPTNVKNTLVIVALDENRLIMPAMPAGSNAIMIGVPGSHSDIGGGYNPQGIQAITLKLAHDFLKTAGVPIADIPLDLQPDWEQMRVHNPALDTYGNVMWDFNNENRYFEDGGIGGISVQDFVAQRLRLDPVYTKVGDKYEFIGFSKTIAADTTDTGTGVRTVSLDVTLLDKGTRVLSRSFESTATDSTGQVLNQLSVTYANDGVSISKTTLSERQKDDGWLKTVRDGQGLLVSTSTTHVQELADGQRIQITETINHMAKGSEVASIKELVTSNGARVVNSTTADGRTSEQTWAKDPATGEEVKQTSKVISYSEAERSEASAEVALAALELMQALRGNNKVQVAASLIRLANNAEIASNKMPTLGAIGTGFSGAVSVVTALDAWGHASDGERIALAARAVLGANDVAKAFSVDGQTGFLESSAVTGALSGIAALSSLDDVIKSGNPFAIASTFMTLTNAAVATGMVSSSAAAAALGMEAASSAAVFGPQVMIAVAICAIVFGGLFGGDIYYPAPPPAGSIDIEQQADGSWCLLIKDGDGRTNEWRSLTGEVLLRDYPYESYWDDDGKAQRQDITVYKDQDWGLGAHVLSQRMVGLISALQAQATQEGAHLVLDRLPSLSVHAFPSFDRNGVDNFFFAMRFNDPLTGAERLLASSHQDLAMQFKEVSLSAGVLVGATEWAQIQAKRLAGDAFATETEGQFLDRHSGAQEGDSLLTQAQNDKQAADNRQSITLLTLDLEGDGVARQVKPQAGMDLLSVQADTTQGITRFDVDNDGYMELTEWVGSKEAILAIDRNSDGHISAATELFTGGGLSDEAEKLGLKRLAFFDANLDGKLDKLDVYFNSFKLWLDINGDARTGIGELHGLAAVGVQSIDVRTGAVTFSDGQSIALQQTQLQADVRGVAVQTVSDGQGSTMVGQYMVQQEGENAELNLTADAAQDLSDILQLVKPHPLLSASDKARLTALAQKYGVDLTDPAALLGLGGGGHQAESPTHTTASASDVFTVDAAPNADEVKAALRAFFHQVVRDPNAGPALDHHIVHTNEDTPFKIKVGDLLNGLAGVSLVRVQDARRGEVSIDEEGQVVFTPWAHQNGTAYFSYTAQDANGRLSTAMVWLSVASVNDVPMASHDAFSVLEDHTLTLTASQLLANDSDPDTLTQEQASLQLISVGHAQHGTVSLVDGQVVFKAESDFQGLASFDYTIRDTAGATASATAQVTVVGQNDAPHAIGQTPTIIARPDALLRVERATVLAYLQDADLVYGDELRIAQVLAISRGRAWLQKDGSLLFKADGIGDAVVTLQVADTQGLKVSLPINLSVQSSHDVVEAVLPGVDQASEDTSVRMVSTLDIVRVVSCLNGEAFIDQDGAVVYTPNRHYNGVAEVVYEVRHADGSTAQTVMDFHVAAVNDLPVVVNALAEQSVNEDESLIVSNAALLATVGDVDVLTNGQRLAVTRVGDAINGTVTLDAQGNAVFTPHRHFNGSAQFKYWVSDNEGASVAALANVRVLPVNDTPEPLAHTLQLLEDEERLFTNAALIAQADRVDVDTQTNGDVLRVTRIALDEDNAVKAQVGLDAWGNITVKPTADFHGSFSLHYTVTDSAGASGQSTLTFNVAAVNDAPVAKASTVLMSSGTEDNAKWIPFSELVGHFTDVDGDSLTVRSVTQSEGGQAHISGNHVVFTPVKDFNEQRNGYASFSYTVSDPSGATGTATAWVPFVNVNDAPVAAYKRIEGRAYEDAELRLGFSELLGGAYDADGDVLSLKSVQALDNSTVWVDWDKQQVVFKGGRDFNGWSGFNYTLSDPSGATSTQRVDIKVQAVNDNPTLGNQGMHGFTVAEDGFFSANQDARERAVIRLRLQDVGASDVEGNALRFAEVWNTNHVNVWRDGNDLCYRLDQNYNGPAGFNYRVRDDQGGWADGYVGLNVVAQNDKPWLTGLHGWPDNAAVLGGNFSARIYGFDVDSSDTSLRAAIGMHPTNGDVSLSEVPAFIWGGKIRSAATLPAQWDLSYNNRYGDEASKRVMIGVDVWDQQGGWARQYVDTYHQGTVASRGGKPVAIDLNGDGIHYTNLDDSKVLFDINGDGVKDLLSWTAADDGLIVFDKDGDGLIQHLDEVSFLSYLEGSMTDLEGLKGFDTDGDGKLTAHDALWAQFGVWQDKSQDGVTDPGEFKRLEEWGITSIDLTSDQRMDQVGDVYIMGKSTFTRSDGSSGEIADAAFRYLDAADTSGLTQKKTFNIDIEGVIRRRLEEAHQQGASDEDLMAMLNKFIADVAYAGRGTVDVQATDPVAWADAQYLDPNASAALDKHPSLQLTV